jgi:hypothetical protein
MRLQTNTSLSVGSGLDTRPWRLDLSPDLRWIEIDFADVLDYKDGLMSGERPRCRRERLTVDVNDAAQRRAMYEAAGSSPALMITEGTALPIGCDCGRAGRRSLHAQRCFPLDQRYHDVGVQQGAWRRGGTMQSIRHVQASDALKGKQLLEVLERHGWTTSAMRS